MQQQKTKYIPTGNEMVSLPTIREKDAAIEGITFLHMASKGMLEIAGKNAENPFLKPYVEVDGINLLSGELNWKSLKYWIPVFTCSDSNLTVEGTILTPVRERGFIYSINVSNGSGGKKDVTLGFSGCWSKTIHEINESKEVSATKMVYKSGWNHNIVFDLRNSFNIFSFAPMLECDCETTYSIDEDTTIRFDMNKRYMLEPGETVTFNLYWGFGYDEVASATSAKEMLRKGFGKVLKSTVQWMNDRVKTTGDEKLDSIMNRNMFFNFFFASGITLDTEEFVLVTSRSPRYYVSAAYWDRDSLLWSFPSILLVDAAYAREMLMYVFNRQIRNIGIHSRYIDGTVLEPGFELDEACAPVIALNNYLSKTMDDDILSELCVIKGLDRILKLIESKRHPEEYLYETFLQPTDDIIVHPYLTYDNVLVWKSFKCLATFYNRIGKKEKADRLEHEAELVRNAIWKNCTVVYKNKSIFAWSIDLDGNWNIYDEPPGSLQLLPFYDFCDATDPVYQNTLDVIRDPEYQYSFSGFNIAETGCAHAPHPWILSVANSLICGRKEHCRDILDKVEMDNGIACESVDENTGECTTGEAFATCAGFLAYSIYHAFGRK